MGKTARFPDGNRVVPIDQAEGTLVRDEFYSQFAGKSAAQLRAHWAKIVFTGLASSSLTPFLSKSHSQAIAAGYTSK